MRLDRSLPALSLCATVGFAAVAASGRALATVDLRALTFIGVGALAARAMSWLIREHRRPTLRANVGAQLAARLAAASVPVVQRWDTGDVEMRLFRAQHQHVTLALDLLPALIGGSLALGTLAVIVAATVPMSVVGRLALLAVVGSIMLAVADREHRRRLEVARKAEERVTSAVGHLVQGHRDVLARGHQSVLVLQISRATGTWANALQRAGVVGALSGRTLAAGSAVAVSWAAFRWAGLSDADATEVALLTALLAAAASVADAASQVRRASLDLKAFDQVLDGPVDAVSLPDATRVVDLSRGITFRKVAIRYPGSSARAVEGVDFTWGAGEVVALSGPNGSGKSTILACVLRLVDTAEGEVFVGDRPLRAHDVHALRTAFAYETDRSYLPAAGTIADAFAFDSATNGPARESAEHWTGHFGLHPCADDSTFWARPIATLSAGQRQRLRLARAFASPCRAIILDEPEANLDAQGMDQLIAALDGIRGHRSVLIAAHDARVLACANRVVTIGVRAKERAATIEP